MKRLPPLLLLLTLCASTVWAASFTLTDSWPFNHRALIIVPASVMEPDIGKPFSPAFADYPANLAEAQRRRLRESVKDLSSCLQKITGQAVPIFIEGDPATAEALKKGTPIYIGASAEKVFGDVGKMFNFKQAFRYVISKKKGVGLYGESDLASSYAIYELLDRLGCRWPMPGELGECIPQMKEITLDETEVALAPSTFTRQIWYGGDDYMRRNRLGGRPLVAYHALEGYISKEQREAHPEWVATLNGQPLGRRLRWSNKEMAVAMAEEINRRLEKMPAFTFSLSPDDGGTFSDAPDDLAIDAGDWDPTLNHVSITDRLLVLCNSIVPLVLEKNPDVYAGVLAYVQYTRPPVREVPNERIVIQIAPISYDRAHPISDTNAPHNDELREIIEGWGKKTKLVSYYSYAYHLAEVTAPCPYISKWGSDLPFIFANNCMFWQPETSTTFETNMHNMHLGNRLAWDTSRKPADIIDDLHERFYGNAAKEMAAYWHYVDDVWTNTKEYTGGDFGYLKRFTPEALMQMRKLMNAGVAAAKTDLEQRRVELANASLRLLELYMRVYRNHAVGNFATVSTDYGNWRDELLRQGNKHSANFTFAMRNHKASQALDWNDEWRKRGYDDAQRIHKECNILTKPLVFKYLPDPISKQDPKNRKDLLAEGLAAGYAKPEFDDVEWKQTNPALDTWSQLDLFDHFTGVWYRTTVDLKEVPEGKKVFLWVGSTDGTAEPWVNGKKVAYVNPKGETTDAKTGKPLVFNGFCAPVSFDITEFVQQGENKVVIYSERKFVNEIGTGGLMGPVMVYSEK